MRVWTCDSLYLSEILGDSRSLKTAPFAKRYMTFYWSAIASIALSCTTFELFNVEHKNSAIANKSCVSYAHNTSRASIVIQWPWNRG